MEFSSSDSIPTLSHLEMHHTIAICSSSRDTSVSSNQSSAPLWLTSVKLIRIKSFKLKQRPVTASPDTQNEQENY